MSDFAACSNAETYIAGMMRNSIATLLVALALVLVTLSCLSLQYYAEGVPSLQFLSPLPDLKPEENTCHANVTILGTFALTKDMPCTALFELTFGSLITYVPELRPCPKVFVFQGVHVPDRNKLDERRYEDFFKNVQQLRISNLRMLQLADRSTLIETVRYGLSHVNTSLIFLWQPDLMLTRRPVDWPQLVQRLLDDDVRPPSPERMRDVHFRYHNDWDVRLHGPRQRFNYSRSFVDDVYVVHYCDQLQLATTSFYRDHVFRLIDLKFQNTPAEDRKTGAFQWGFQFMEGNADVISANHSSLGYGSCYKRHCDRDKRKEAESKLEHWYYVYPADLFEDVWFALDKVRPCRQWNVQLCLPWAPSWFSPKALGCNFLDRLSLYGRLNVALYVLLYGGPGYLLALVLQHKMDRLWWPLRVLLFCGVCCLPWGLVVFRMNYRHNKVCFNPPSFKCPKKH